MRRVGPYEVVRELGHGGMGAVLEVVDPALGRRLALKLVRPDVLDDDARLRFRAEGEALARVAHPGVVRVHAAGVSERGEPYLVTDLVAGRDLKALRAEGPLPWRRCAELARDVADALAAVHAAGVVHRDLKPANVLVRADDGRPVLIDFGLARRLDASRLTESGVILGTPGFMAPEQVTGAPVDARTDVHGLGALLFGLAAGRPPFEGPQLAVLQAVLERDPAWPADVPAGLAAIGRRAMAKDPARRFASAAELRDALARWLAEGDGPAPPRRAVVAAVGLVVVGLAVTGVAAVALRARPPTAPPPPEWLATARARVDEALAAGAADDARRALDRARRAAPTAGRAALGPLAARVAAAELERELAGRGRARLEVVAADLADLVGATDGADLTGGAGGPGAADVRRLARRALEARVAEAAAAALASDGAAEALAEAERLARRLGLPPDDLVQARAAALERAAGSPALTSALRAGDPVFTRTLARRLVAAADAPPPLAAPERARVADAARAPLPAALGLRAPAEEGEAPILEDAATLDQAAAVVALEDVLFYDLAPVGSPAPALRAACEAVAVAVARRAVRADEATLLALLRTRFADSPAARVVIDAFGPSTDDLRRRAERSAAARLALAAHDSPWGDPERPHQETVAPLLERALAAPLQDLAPLLSLAVRIDLAATLLGTGRDPAAVSRLAREAIAGLLALGVGSKAQTVRMEVVRALVLLLGAARREGGEAGLARAYAEAQGVLRAAAIDGRDAVPVDVELARGRLDLAPSSPEALACLAEAERLAALHGIRRTTVVDLHAHRARSRLRGGDAPDQVEATLDALWAREAAEWLRPGEVERRSLLALIAAALKAADDARDAAARARWEARARSLPAR